MAAAGARGRGRYGNVRKPVIDGHRFDSKYESERYLELKLLEKAGKIRDLELQPRFPIEIFGLKIMMRSQRYPNGRQLTYVADFRYVDIEKAVLCKKCEKPLLGIGVVIEDVKMQSGHSQPEYKIKRALMQAMGYQITEV